MKALVLCVLILLLAFSAALAGDMIGLVRHDREILGWVELQEESLEALALLSEVGVLPEGGSIEYVEREAWQTRAQDLLASYTLPEGPRIVGPQK